MAWKEIKVYEQRKKFIIDYLENILTMSELCRQYEITRPIGYKWLERYNNEGFEGLKDRNRAPLNQTNVTDADLISKILHAKFKYYKWGPKKIRAYLMATYQELISPSVTTIGNILDKNGLVNRRKYRKRFPVKTIPLAHAQEVNDVWSVDFKGWWLTKDNYKCAPITLIDNVSRYLIRCVKTRLNDTEHAWAIFDAAFREYGLPNYMRSDNGPPFASIGVGRLSKLAVNLIKAGVIPDWIEPGNPQENGRHERMHGTLQSEGVFPDLKLEEQQIKFREFQDYYNFERPHEALGQKMPGSVYVPSTRRWNGKLKSPEYPEEHIKGKVKSCGKMSWKGIEIYIGRSLSNEYIGLEKIEGGFRAYYGPIKLGVITNKNEFIIPRRKETRRRTLPKVI